MSQEPQTPLPTPIKLQRESAQLSDEWLAEPQNHATPRVADFSKTVDYVYHCTGRWQDINPGPLTAEGYRLSKVQMSRRIRRTREKYEKAVASLAAEKQAMFQKPIEEWDNEELARGRPRDPQGKFKGRRPLWVTAAVHEEAMDRFKSIVRTGMRVATVDAIEVMQEILTDDSIDNRGKPVVAASTKLQAATFLLEHVVGKPTQRVENDISVKLQTILGAVMVNPAEMATGTYLPGHMPGMTMELATGLVDDDEDLDDRE